MSWDEFQQQAALLEAAWAKNRALGWSQKVFDWEPAANILRAYQATRPWVMDRYVQRSKEEYRTRPTYWNKILDAMRDLAALDEVLTAPAGSPPAGRPG